MLGQVDEQVIAARAQRRVQAALSAELGDDALPLPLPVDGVELGDRRMAGQHRRRFAVHQRIDLGVWRRPAQRREDGGGKQDVAVVAQLGDQHAVNRREVHGVRQET